MDAQHAQEKVKSNGKWAANAKEIRQYSTDIFEAVQDGLTELFKSGSQSAQALAKKYPVETAIGGLCCGFVLGAVLFRSRKAD